MRRRRPRTMFVRAGDDEGAMAVIRNDVDPEPLRLREVTLRWGTIRLRHLRAVRRRRAWTGRA